MEPGLQQGLPDTSLQDESERLEAGSGEPQRQETLLQMGESCGTMKVSRQNGWPGRQWPLDETS